MSNSGQDLDESFWNELDKLGDLMPSEMICENGNRIRLNRGERRYITVLKVDLHNYTGLSEQFDHEIVDRILDTLFRVVTKHIRNRDGWVEKFEGDSVMAAFGTFITHEDDAVRAIDCAMSILKSINAIHDFLISKHFVLDIRIGIDSGEVTRSKRGSTDVLTGMPLITSTRLEESAEQGSILVSENTWKLAKDHYLFRDHPAIHQKGKETGIRCYTVVEKSFRKDRWERTSHSSSHLVFVGRQSELSTLMTIFSDCCKPLQSDDLSLPHHRVIEISGDAGIGKSRLIYEFLKTVRHYPSNSFYPILAGIAAGYASRQYETVITMLKNCLGDNLGSDYSCRMETLFNNLNKYLPARSDRRTIQSILCFLLGETRHDPFLDSMDPRERHQCIIAAVRNLVQAMASMACMEFHAPLIIVWDDFHWIDESSLSVLHSILLTARTPLPMMVLLPFRPIRIFPSASFEKAELIEIHLHPLSDQEGLSLIQGILGSFGDPKTFHELILSRCEGNPYYIEELVNHFHDKHIDLIHVSPLSIQQNAKKIEIPPSLRSMIFTRIDYLETDIKRTLHFASILGDQFDLEPLKWINNRIENPVNLEYCLSVLKERGFIIPVSNTEFQIKHPLAREVSYDSILHQNRHILHNLYAQYLENKYREKSNRYYYELADNWFKCKNIPKAVEYYRKAGHSAHQVYANQTAISAYQNALELLDDTDSQKCVVYFERGMVYRFIGNLEHARSDFSQSLKLASHQNNDVAKLHAFFAFGELHLIQSNFHHAQPCFYRSLELSRRVKDRTMEARSLKSIGMIRLLENEIDKAIPMFERSLAISRAVQDHRQTADTLLKIGRTYITRCEFEAARSFFDEALAFSRTIQDHSLEASVLMQLGIMHQFDIEYEQALDCFQSVLAISQDINDRKNEIDALLKISTNYYCLHQFEMAHEVIASGLQQSRESEIRSNETSLMFIAAESWIAQNEYEKAMRWLEQMVQIDQKEPIGLNKALALFALGHIHKTLGHYPEAMNLLAEALHITQKIYLVLYNGIIMAEIGCLYIETGDYEAAHSHFHQALEILNPLSICYQKQFVAEIIYHIGTLLSCKMHFNEAMEHAREAVRISREGRNRIIECDAMTQMADLFLLQHQYDSAMEYYQQSVSICRDLQLSTRLNLIHSRQARILCFQNHLKEAFGMSCQVMEWIHQNPAVNTYLGLRPEQPFFTHYLILKALAHPDKDPFLEMAYHLLSNRIKSIAEIRFRLVVFKEPWNASIIQEWESRFGEVEKQEDSSHE